MRLPRRAGTRRAAVWRLRAAFGHSLGGIAFLRMVSTVSRGVVASVAAAALLAAAMGASGALAARPNLPLMAGLTTAAGPTGGLLGRGYDPIFMKVRFFVQRAGTFGVFRIRCVGSRGRQRCPARWLGAVVCQLLTYGVVLRVPWTLSTCFLCVLVFVVDLFSIRLCRAT